MQSSLSTPASDSSTAPSLTISLRSSATCWPLLHPALPISPGTPTSQQTNWLDTAQVQVHSHKVQFPLHSGLPTHSKSPGSAPAPSISTRFSPLTKPATSPCHRLNPSPPSQHRTSCLSTMTMAPPMNSSSTMPCWPTRSLTIPGMSLLSDSARPLLISPVTKW